MVKNNVKEGFCYNNFLYFIFYLIIKSKQKQKICSHTSNTCPFLCFLCPYSCAQPIEIYQAQSDIDGIAAVDSSTLAAATKDKIVLMDMDGTVYKTLQGEIKGFFFYRQAR